MTTCPNCGERFSPDWKVCPKCGTPLCMPSDLSGLAAREQGIKFPPPREITEEATRQIVEESIRAQREFKELTRPMEAIADQPPPKPGTVSLALEAVQREIEERRELEAEVQRLREKNDGLTRAVCGDGEQIAGLERELDDLRAENQRLKSRLAGAPWEG